MNSAFDADPILVEVTRGDLVESVHHARIAITKPDGSLAAAIGEPFGPIYARSSLKPLQLVGMVRAGLDFDDEQLALSCASHSGEPFQIDTVRAMLAASELGEADLQTPPDYPIDEQAKIDWIAAGKSRQSVAMNCSGKHAAMLRTAVLLGAPTETYRSPDHPVQLAILQAIDDLSGQQATDLTTDGCGAPLWAFELYGLARAFGRLAGATEGPEAKVAAAIRAHPEYVSGTRRDEYELHQAVPGLIGKAGAEAVHAVGLPDGRGIAIKIGDGGARARTGLMAAVLQAMGYDHPTLERHQHVATLGHGEPVGEIRPVSDLRQRLGL